MGRKPSCRVQCFLCLKWRLAAKTIIQSKENWRAIFVNVINNLRGKKIFPLLITKVATRDWRTFTHSLATVLFCSSNPIHPFQQCLLDPDRRLQHEFLLQQLCFPGRHPHSHIGSFHVTSGPADGLLGWTALLSWMPFFNFSSRGIFQF